MRVNINDLETAIEWLGAYEAEGSSGKTIDGSGANGDPFAESLLRVREMLRVEVARREAASTERKIVAEFNDAGEPMGWM